MSALRRSIRGLKHPSTLLLVGFPILIVAIWWQWSASADSFFFPPLADILATFGENWVFERVGSDLIPSMQRFGIGYVLSVVIGVGVGIALGLNKIVASLTGPLVEFMRAVPPVALLPFTIVVIGIGDRGKVFLIVLGSLWPVLLNTIDGVRGVDQNLIDAARSYGATRMELLRSVLVPAALPQIAAGMRSALSIALILTVISELWAATEGVGFFVLQSQRNFDMPAMWSGMIMLSIVGLLLNIVFSIVESRFLRWYYLRSQMETD